MFLPLLGCKRVLVAQVDRRFSVFDGSLFVVLVCYRDVVLGSQEGFEVECVQSSPDVIEDVVYSVVVVLFDVPVPVKVGVASEGSSNQPFSQTGRTDNAETFRSMLELF